MATPEEMSERLQSILRRLNKVQADKQRLEGKREAADKAVQEQYQKCREQGVEPEELPDKIEALTKAIGQTLDVLDRQVADAETKIAPYLEDGE